MHDQEEFDPDTSDRNGGMTGEGGFLDDPTLDADDEVIGEDMVGDFDDDDFEEVTDIPYDSAWSEYEGGDTVDWDEDSEDTMEE